jgi:putative oxidoreductase
VLALYGREPDQRHSPALQIERQECRSHAGRHLGETMTLQTTNSHSALSGTDSFATARTDAILLIGRILLGYIFLAAGWGKLGNIAGTTAYFTNLKVPAPELCSWVVGIFELLMGAALILGFATRYASLAVFVFVLIATVIAHRYWEYPAAQQGAQWNNLLKNLSIMGGALLLFATGAGRYSVDAAMKK